MGVCLVKVVRHSGSSNSTDSNHSGYSVKCKLANVELKEFHSYVFSSFILAPAHFDVCTGTCAKCSVEPRQIWGITAGVASGTAVLVPEGVVSEPTDGRWSTITVIVLTYKGWWL